MNYLIVMPRMAQKDEWYHFAFGIAYVSACMKRDGLSVSTLNLNYKGDDTRGVLQAAMDKNRIDVVLTAGITSQYKEIRAVMENAKEFKPDCITICGGGIITSAPKSAMQALEFADYGVVGEGEVTVSRLCRALSDGTDIRAVDGIIIKEGYIQTKPREEIACLDTLPLPDYAGFEFDQVISKGAPFICRSASGIPYMGLIVGSRSCPFQCTFCFHTSGSKYRQRSLDNFFEEVDYLVEHYHIQFLHVIDELFSFSKDRIREFCRRIKPYGLKWHAQFRVCDMTEDIVEEIKASNCVGLAYGLESADNRILKSMRKAITIEQIEKTLRITHKAGLKIEGNFIFGDVEETMETVNNTLSWWEEHPYDIGLGMIRTYPGTPLYKYAVEHRIIQDEIEFIRNGCPLVNLSKLSDEEFTALQRKIGVLAYAKSSAVLDLKDAFLDQNHCLYFRGTCEYCGAEVNCRNLDVFEDVSYGISNDLFCDHCQRRLRLPIFDDFKVDVRREVEKLTAGGERLAFWGIGGIFEPFVAEHLGDLLQSDQIYLIDKDKDKHQQIVYGKKIYSPAVLLDGEIKTVVVTAAAAHQSAIERQIKSEYPSVKAVFHCSRLFEGVY